MALKSGRPEFVGSLNLWTCPKTLLAKFQFNPLNPPPTILRISWIENSILTNLTKFGLATSLTSKSALNGVIFASLSTFFPEKLSLGNFATNPTLNSLSTLSGRLIEVGIVHRGFCSIRIAGLSTPPLLFVNFSMNSTSYNLFPPKVARSIMPSSRLSSNFSRLRRLIANLILPLPTCAFLYSNTLTDFTTSSDLTRPPIFFPPMILKLNFSPIADFLSTLLTSIQFIFFTSYLSYHFLFHFLTFCSNSLFYQKKRAEGKDHLTAIGHVCHKILAIIFAVLRDNKSYVPASASWLFITCLYQENGLCFPSYTIHFILPQQMVLGSFPTNEKIFPHMGPVFSVGACLN